MLHEATLNTMRIKLLSTPGALTPAEAAFLVTLLTSYVTEGHASDLYLTAVRRPSTTQPMPAFGPMVTGNPDLDIPPAREDPQTPRSITYGDDFPQSLR